MTPTSGTVADASPLLELFRDEVIKQARALATGLEAARRSVAPALACEPLVQAAQAIQSAAAIVRAEAVVTVARELSKCLAAVQAGNMALSTGNAGVLLEVVNVLAPLAEMEYRRLTGESLEPRVSLEPMLEKLLALATDSPAVLAPEHAATEPSTPATSHRDTSLLDMFREEVRNCTTTLNRGLVVLEEDPGNAERIEPLMRAAHSIKGAARVVGVDAAVQVAHAMEDVLVAAQHGRIVLGANEIDVLLRGVDLLTQVSQLDEQEFPSWRSDANPTVANAIRQLEACATSTKHEAGQAAAPPTPLPTAIPVAIPATVVPVPATVRSAAAIEQAEGLARTTHVLPGVASHDRSVRVTAESLSRLMGLAGESLVEARWLQPFAKSLLALRRHQDQLAGLVDELGRRWTGKDQGDGAPGVVAEARQRIAECRRLLGERLSEFEVHARQSDDLNTKLYDEVIASRMRPFGDVAQGYTRMVRDLARQLGKKARLDLVGLEAEVDRDVLEKLDAPLNHILRNAVDHAIEAPAERRAAGKPEIGTIRVEARHVAGMLSIAVRDDGRGIDTERMRRKVLERQLTTAEIAERLSEAELLEFLFLPGFSTAERVTEVSGRGVGLDVVQNMVQSVGGSARVTTKVGQGTIFLLQLPITLSVIRAVLVEIGGEVYAFPHNRIDRLLRVPMAELQVLEGRQYCTVDGRHVGLMPGHQVLDLATPPRADDVLFVVLLSMGHQTVGIIVDGFRGEQDLVVRPLDPRLRKVPDLNAAALLDDGSPVLIVDVDDVVRSIDTLLQTGRPRTTRRSDGPVVTKHRKRILVVDDSIIVREVERQMLANCGFEVDVAVDGLDGWKAVRAGDYDLILSDVDMPGMNGLDFVRLIKQDAKLRSLPIIIVSYKGSEQDRLRGLEAGANYYLTKDSFDDTRLIEAVRELIGGPDV